METKYLADERGLALELIPVNKKPAHTLWDQLDIFKKHVSDYRFGGSNSLKSVLPVIVPELSYKLLDVQNGTQAQVVWEAMIGEGETAVQGANG